MKKYLSISLLLLVALSCTDDKSADEILKFETRSNCSIVDDCASKVEILPLRTAGAMIGEVMQCKETAAGFMVVDYDYNIFCFNASGELQNKIARVGRGPQEYVSVAAGWRGGIQFPAGPRHPVRGRIFPAKGSLKIVLAGRV